MNDKYSFYYTQKLVIFRNNDQEILLARRTGEVDMNATYSCIGGKLEAKDNSLVRGLEREKNEEVGQDFKVEVCPTVSFNVLFVRKDGQQVIVPHCYARYISGEVKLNEEHDEYKWVKLSELDDFEPKIANIPGVCKKLLALRSTLEASDFVKI